jgi:predicted acyltransferase
MGVTRKKLLYKILTRTVIIFVIGLFLNAFPSHFDFSTIRILGVLQRIAICYFFASLLFLTTRITTQALIITGLLIGYWLIMTMLPVPEYGINNLTQNGNLAAYVDRFIFSSSHLYEKTFDPEGLLSTLPALATTLIGNLTGAWLLSQHNKQKKLQGIVIAGVIALIIGWLWGMSFPINKSLWTSSYVLWSAGLALLLLLTLYWLIEIRNWKKWTKPFEIFGLNAIAAYFLHVFFLKVQAMIHIAKMDGSPGNLRTFITEHLFGWASLPNASLMYAMSYTLLWFLLLTILYRNKIFIKI